MIRIELEEIRKDDDTLFLVYEVRSGEHRGTRFVVQGQILPSMEEQVRESIVDFARVKYGSTIADEFNEYLTHLCSSRGAVALSKFFKDDGLDRVSIMEFIDGRYV